MAKREELSKTTGLTMLGAGKTVPSRKLEAFPFKHSGNNTLVTFLCEEFSCVCPLTGQPDYATLEISYEPLDHAIESKSLKNYLWSFRDTGVFHEDMVNRILEDVWTFANPRYVRVLGHFNIRGGIAIVVEASRGKASAR
ncbi:preQ(1) synthase [soil metagenome]